MNENEENCFLPINLKYMFVEESMLAYVQS